MGPHENMHYQFVTQARLLFKRDIVNEQSIPVVLLLKPNFAQWKQEAIHSRQNTSLVLSVSSNHLDSVLV